MKISPLDDTCVDKEGFEDTSEIKNGSQADDNDGIGAMRKDASKKRKWSWAQERGW